MPLVQVEKNTDSGRGLKHLVLRAPKEILAQYVNPGQYIVLSRGEQKGFFAIASAPDADRFDLLVKAQEGLSTHICNMQAGDEIECSAVQGPGFDLMENKDTHLFSMGSGLSPFRALIEHHLCGDFKPAKLTLWQGSFDQEHLPFPEDCTRWQELGVDVKLCFDRDASRAENVRLRLEREAPNLVDSVCYWIGSKEFGLELQASAEKLGLPPGNYRTNF